MQQRVDIAITGSGSLATEVIHNLARAARDDLNVALLGRDADRLARLARSAGDIAATAGARVQVLPVVIDWSDDVLIRRTLAVLRPRVLVHTASLQSPWTLDGSDRWSSLVQKAGFGFTLPLQAVLTLKVARAIADETFLINGCYPDAVNRILVENKLKVFGGLGNIAILAVLLCSGLPEITQGKRLRMIAHHAHIAAARHGRKLKEARPKAWIDEQPIHDIAESFFINAGLQSNLNSIAAQAAAPMLFALLGRGPDWNGHSAGALGLPGGYPVIVSEGRVELDLPAEITLDEAKAINVAAGIADGVILGDNGEVALVESSRPALETIAPNDSDYFMSWHASEVEEQAARLLALRESLSG